MKNKKILIGGGQGLSHISRMLSVSEHIKNDFDIYVVSQEGTIHSELVKNNGLIPVTYARYNQSWNPIINPFQEFYDFESMMQVYHPFDPSYLDNSLESEKQLVKEIKPNLIISDSCLNFSFLAKLMGIPLLSVVQGKFHPKMRLKWRSKEKTEVDPLFLDYYNRYAKGSISFESLEEVLSGNINLIPSFSEFGEVDEDDTTKHIGPTLYKSNNARIFDEIPGRKVYVYMGSYEKDLGLLKVIARITEQFIEQKEFSFVFAYGNNKVKDIKEPPFYHFGYLPGFTAIRDCDISINHGGHTSCMGGIYHSTPSIIIPTNAERDWNAQKIEELGFGKRISLCDLDNLNIKTLKEMLHLPMKKIDLDTYNASQKRWIVDVIKKLSDI